MPWTTPTLRQVREMVRDDITASLHGAAFIGNNVLRVMADAMAGLAHHVLRYIDWLALQQALSAVMATWDDSTNASKARVKIYSPSTPTNFFEFNITGTLTDNGTWDTFPITSVASGGTLT